MVSAMSIPRMTALLDLLDEDAGDVGLPSPKVECNSIPVFDKRTRKQYELPPERTAKRKRRGGRRKRV